MKTFQIGHKWYLRAGMDPLDVPFGAFLATFGGLLSTLRFDYSPIMALWSGELHYQCVWVEALTRGPQSEQVSKSGMWEAFTTETLFCIRPKLTSGISQSLENSHQSLRQESTSPMPISFCHDNIDSAPRHRMRKDSRLRHSITDEPQTTIMMQAPKDLGI